VCVTVEEGAIGGLGAHVLTLASDEGLIDAGLKLRTLRLPDVFQDQDKPEKQYAEADRSIPRMAATARSAWPRGKRWGWMRSGGWCRPATR
jgi:1-deoxy-D-xylulose-5-phosphate synthase